MAAFVDRTAFRLVLKEIVKCLRENFDVPGVAPLGPEHIMSWFNNVTLQDLEAVAHDIDQGRTEGLEHAGWPLPVSFSETSQSMR